MRDSGYSELGKEQNETIDKPCVSIGRQQTNKTMYAKETKRK